MKTDLSKIKDKLAKLLRLSEDGGASEGEIQNALAMSSRLMAKHQLTREDVCFEDEDPIANVQYGRRYVYVAGKHIRGWENSLMWFVVEFMGTVSHYQERGSHIIRKNGIVQLTDRDEPKYASRYCFYGPDDDCEVAAELFEELHAAIVIMATTRYGTHWRGDGAAYSEGFVYGLKQANRKAKIELKQGDEATGAYMLQVQKTELALVDGGKDWLRRECKIKLTTSRASRGTTCGSGAAHNEGKQDGSNYSVNKPNATKKLS